MKTYLDRSGSAVLAGLLILLAAGVAVVAMADQWTMSAIPDVGLRDQRQRADSLETARAVGLTRLELNSQVLNDLVGGRCSFAEAVALRTEINQGSHAPWDSLRVAYPDVADYRELMARALVTQVEMLAEEYPGRYDGLVSHVRKELAAMTQHTDVPVADKAG